MNYSYDWDGDAMELEGTRSRLKGGLCDGMRRYKIKIEYEGEREGTRSNKKVRELY